MCKHLQIYLAFHAVVGAPYSQRLLNTHNSEKNIRFATYKNKQLDFSEIDLSIIKLLCQKKLNGEIADLLHMSCRTVEWHRIKILQKIGARNIAGIIIYAMRSGIYQ